jgi:hypothetical protein
VERPGQKNGTPVCVPEGTRPGLECKAYTAQEQCLSHSAVNTKAMGNEKKKLVVSRRKAGAQKFLTE